LDRLFIEGSGISATGASGLSDRTLRIMERPGSASQTGDIADNKQLGSVLAMIRNEQLRRGPERRSGPAGAISAMHASSWCAEVLYEPSELVLAR
jgi:hypothetical protein